MDLLIHLEDNMKEGCTKTVDTDAVILAVTVTHIQHLKIPNYG